MSDLFDELVSWLRIPSVSAGARNNAALREAAEWALSRVRNAGGVGELVETPSGAPLVVVELRSAREDAPAGATERRPMTGVAAIPRPAQEARTDARTA